MSHKPVEQFKTQWGPYYLESGAREVLSDLWESVFKKPSDLESFFSGMSSTRHIRGRQALLIWMFLRLNKKYQTAAKALNKVASKKWYMLSFINPKTVNPIPKNKSFIRSVFERPALKQIDLKRKTDLFEHRLLLDNPSMQPENYLFLRIPPHTSDSEIQKVVQIWRDRLISPAAFKQIKGSNRRTIIHCLLALYLSERAENADLAKAFRAATNDLFPDRLKNQPHRSKSKIQTLLARSKEIRDSAPFNFLFSAG